MKDNKYIWGILLIIIGAGSLATNWLNINLFGLSNMWPLFVLIPGVCFEYAYFRTRRNPGLLVPGGILVTIGLLFFFETFTNWYFSGYTWPIYILAVAVGLFQLYYFGIREVALLAVSVGIGGFAMLFLVNNIFGGMFRWLRSSSLLPIVLIAVGVIIIISGLNKPKDKE